MKRHHIGLLVLLTVTTMSTAAISEEHGDGRPEEGRSRREHMGPRDREHSRGPGVSSMMEGLSLARLASSPHVAKELGLTDEQVEALKTGSYELKKEEINLRAKQELAAMEQIRLMGEDDIDEKALMKAVEKTAEISAELAKLRVRQILLVKKTLTKEQLTRMREMMHERMQQRNRGMRAEGMRDRGGRRGPHGDRDGRERPVGKGRQEADADTEED